MSETMDTAADGMVFGSREKAWPDVDLLPDPNDPDLTAWDVEDVLTGWDYLPDHARKALDRALRDKRSGTKAASAVFTAPNEWRGWVARLFHLRLVEGEGSLNQHRAALEQAWDHDHAAVGAAAGCSRRILRQMFADAEFRVPSRIGDPVTLYRGLTVDEPRARRGASWTTDKRVAAWFALRGPEGGPALSPVVLRCAVPRASVLHWSDERQEREAVCFDTEGAVVDGDRAEWERLAAECIAARKR